MSVIERIVRWFNRPLLDPLQMWGLACAAVLASQEQYSDAIYVVLLTVAVSAGVGMAVVLMNKQDAAHLGKNKSDAGGEKIHPQEGRMP